jgi:LysM repeat protein
VALAALVLAGCLPGGHSQLDEEREPHFLEGKRRVTALDYPGAIESFEKALAVNPRSASAHFEAGLLYENNQQDYAAAIYHFDRFLQLRPRSDYADVVKQSILACKQELAKTISLGPVTQGLQHEFERLAEDNKQLKEELERWRSYAKNLQSLTNSPPVAPTPAPGRAVSAPVLAVNPGSAPASSAAYSQPARVTANAAATSRTHTVKSGETPAGIARKYGLRVDALMAANPKLDARRMQIGQTLNLPVQ